MKRLTAAISKRDSRFEGELFKVGSSFEGTRVGDPNEFDFNVKLLRFAQLCTPRKCDAGGLYRLEVNVSDDLEEFRHFFDVDGYLLTTRMNLKFQALLKEVLHDAEFWKDEAFFEVMDRDVKTEYQFLPRKICTTVLLGTFRKIGPMQDDYFLSPISIDIVPCIHIDAWRPKDAVTSLPNVEQADFDEILDRGCCFVFALESGDVCESSVDIHTAARVSFSYAESRLMRICPPLFKAAYMIGKWLMNKAVRSSTDANERTSDLFFSSHLLKTAVWKTITDEANEMPTSSRNVNDDYDDLEAGQLTETVRKVFKVVLGIAYDDYVTSILMPSVRLPVRRLEDCVPFFRRRNVDHKALFEAVTFRDGDPDNQFVFSIAMSHLLYRSVSEEGADICNDLQQCFHKN